MPKILFTKRSAIALLALLISLLFGVNEAYVNNWLGSLDPPKAGYARVVEVVDGDTIVVDFEGKSEKVRFIGLDTPETHHPEKPVQCFGEAAHAHLAELIDENDVRLEADPENSNRDRYDRLLRYVYLEDGTLLNLKMIEDGYGFAYTAFDFSKKPEFTYAQSMASERKYGLWNECDIEVDGIFTNTAPAEGGE